MAARAGMAIEVLAGMRWLKDAVLVVAGVLIPVAPVGVLLAAVLPRLELARWETARYTDMPRLGEELLRYHQETGRYPLESEGFGPLVSAGITNRIPMDPWKHPYRLERWHGLIRISSLGHDGAVGGTGNDADLDCFMSIGGVELREWHHRCDQR